MSTTSIIPTSEQRLQILHVYGEKGDRLVREKERQYITS
ncbi:transcriptional regulator, partial [Klebsiella pneumoniae]